MAVEAVKVDSSAVDLHVAVEETVGALPATPVWRGHLANEYPDFGSETQKTPRNPISRRRARLKGSTTDLDAAGGFQEDLTQDGASEDVFPGVFMSDKRRQPHHGPAPEAEGTIVAVTSGAGGGYQLSSPAEAAKYAAGNVVWAEGFIDGGNNGLKTVIGVTTDVVEVAGTVADGSPAGSIRRVGWKMASGDLEVVANAQELPLLRTTIFDVTNLGLIPGQWLHVGGDDSGATGDAFDAAHNNGFARVYAVEGNTDIRLDLTAGGADGATAPVTEGGGTKEIVLFTGDMLRNEATDAAEFNRLTFQVERTLGKPNPQSEPNRVQSEVLTGCFTNQVAINVPQADKITLDVGYTALRTENRDGSAGQEPKSEDGSATKVSGSESDAFNTSSDFSIIKMCVLPPVTGAQATSVPDPLFAFVTNMTVTLANNITPDKAVSVLGAFDASVGNFQADVELTAYFADVAAKAAVEDNKDVELHWVVVKDWLGRKAGILVDVCLLSLGDGRVQVNLDDSVRVPLTGADGQYAPFGHNASLNEFWYLPDAADL